MKYTCSQSSAKANTCGRAFSLVELLVVIAIIGIITALLFPVFARARQKTGNELCVSNLHQIYLATQLYLQDYDHVYPFAVTDNTRRRYLQDPKSKYVVDLPYAKYIPTLPTVQAILDPYDGKARTIFHCPYDTQKKIAWLQITNWATYGASYSLDDWIGLNGQTEATIEHFSQRALANDVLAGWHTPEVEPADDMGKRRGNVQYLDGHCKSECFQDCMTKYYP